MFDRRFLGFYSHYRWHIRRFSDGRRQSTSVLAKWQRWWGYGRRRTETSVPTSLLSWRVVKAFSRRHGTVQSIYFAMLWIPACTRLLASISVMSDRYLSVGLNDSNRYQVYVKGSLDDTMLELRVRFARASSKTCFVAVCPRVDADLRVVFWQSVEEDKGTGLLAAGPCRVLQLRSVLVREHVLAAELDNRHVFFQVLRSDQDLPARVRHRGT